MKPRRVTIISLLCALLSPAGARDAGPPIGSAFPERGLKSILGPKGAVILSGARALPQDQEELRKLGLGIAKAASKVPAAWYVLNAHGVVLAKYPEADTLGAILVHQFGWTPPEPVPEVDGKQLTAKAEASDAAAAPGDRVALILDLDLEPGMHVYAPGVTGYIPIEWKMEDSTAAAAEPPIFPHSEKLFLKAINETVPAYRGHFRIIRDISIAQQTQLPLDGKITVPGALRYQACDDRVCYIPKELHFAWTFRYERPAATTF